MDSVGKLNLVKKSVFFGLVILNMTKKTTAFIFRTLSFQANRNMYSAVFYLSKTSFLLCFFCCAMAACNPIDTHQQAIPAFYHWQTKLPRLPWREEALCQIF
jgi:hypothetical protein